MSEWKIYDGSDEQITALLTTKGKFIVDGNYSIFNKPQSLRLKPIQQNIDWLMAMFKESGVTKFLFCNHHPLVDMIKRQADTGQPVYIKYIDEETDELVMYSTDKPDWNIPGAEYSFTPFSEEK